MGILEEDNFFKQENKENYKFQVKLETNTIKQIEKKEK